MKKKDSGIPTKGELEVLQILWQRGPSTVREVHESIDRGGAYTTSLKQLQIMTEKGLVEREEAGRAHIYRAKLSEKEGAGDFLGDLVERVFDGSLSRLVMQALGSGQTSPAELKAIRKLLDEAQKGKR